MKTIRIICAIYLFITPIMLWTAIITHTSNRPQLYPDGITGAQFWALAIIHIVCWYMVSLILRAISEQAKINKKAKERKQITFKNQLN